jgi:hypothetical protein
MSNVTLGTPDGRRLWGVPAWLVASLAAGVIAGMALVGAWVWLNGKRDENADIACALMMRQNADRYTSQRQGDGYLCLYFDGTGNVIARERVEADPPRIP